MLIPCVNLLVILTVSRDATRLFSASGYRVGFLGTNMAQFR